jgi:hypothetical protein
MFSKLEYNFEKPLFTTIDGLTSFAGIDGRGVGHKKVWSPDAEQFYKVIPKRYWNDFDFTLMTINSQIYPHIDRDYQATINFYLETGGEYKTVFFANGELAEINNLVDYSSGVYDENTLSEVGNFTAKNGEAWLLDVSLIHTVHNTNGTDRKALALRTTKYKYIEVYEMLKETGYVV